MTDKKERSYGVVDSKHGKVAGNIPCGVSTRGGAGKGSKVGDGKPSKNK